MAALKILFNKNPMGAFARTFGIKEKRTQAYYDECAKLWADGRRYFNPRTKNYIYTQGDRTIVAQNIGTDIYQHIGEAYPNSITSFIYGQPFDKIKKDKVLAPKIIFDSNWSPEKLYDQRLLERLTSRTNSLHSEPFNMLA